MTSRKASEGTHGATAASCGSPAVALLRDVTLRYGLRPVLRKVSLALHPGEVVGLIGPGGAGKTQLLKVLSTLRIPWEGDVRLFGQPVERWNRTRLTALRGRVGLQFQNFALFDYLDVSRNVAFPLEHGMRRDRAQIASCVASALADVGLADHGRKLPGELSGGMRRRVAIARVVAARPDLALFDDPVAGLDPVNSARIMALIRRFAASCPGVTVVATHDLPRLARIATRLIALFDGRVLYDGPADRAADAADERVRSFIRAGQESPPSTPSVSACPERSRREGPAVPGNGQWR